MKKKKEIILLELREFFADYQNDMAKRIKERLSIDIRGNTCTYQKPYTAHFDML